MVGWRQVFALTGFVLVACSSPSNAPGNATGGDDANLTGSPLHAPVTVPSAFSPPAWEDGTSCDRTPAVQEWRYSPSTFIFRQSVCTNFEAPFIYLLLGDQRAFMLDSGTGDADIRGPVDRAIQTWMTERNLPSIELIVGHTHSHGDHVQGDSQFRGRPNTRIVPYRAEQIASFYGLSNWPAGEATLDLGNRPLKIIPIPGHEQGHIAVHDPQQELLFTGDTLYPGRLYIDNWGQFQTSVHRLVDAIDSQQLKVKWVLGAHIEMSKEPGDDYPFQAQTHPNEHQMHQPLETLRQLDSASQAMSVAEEKRFDHFIIYP